MNREDRAALIEIGQQFAPSLFQGFDAVLTKDELLIRSVGDAFSMLAAQIPPPAEADAERPEAKAVERWFQRQGVKVTRRQVILEPQPGGRVRQRYQAKLEDAKLADLLSWRFEPELGNMHLVMSDGQTYCLPFMD